MAWHRCSVHLYSDKARCLNQSARALYRNFIISIYTGASCCIVKLPDEVCVSHTKRVGEIKSYNYSSQSAAHSLSFYQKKTMKWKEQELYARAMAKLPRILFECQRGNVRYARLGLIKWLKYSLRKALRGNLPVRYQGLTLRFAVNVDFVFLNKLFGLKLTINKCNFWCCYLAEKLAFWAFLPNERWYAAKIGRCSRFAGCDDGNIHQLVPFTHYHDVVT